MPFNLYLAYLKFSSSLIEPSKFPWAWLVLGIAVSHPGRGCLQFAWEPLVARWQLLIFWLQGCEGTKLTWLPANGAHCPLWLYNGLVAWSAFFCQQTGRYGVCGMDACWKEGKVFWLSYKKDSSHCVLAPSSPGHWIIRSPWIVMQ